MFVWLQERQWSNKEWGAADSSLISNIYLDRFEALLVLFLLCCEQNSSLVIKFSFLLLLLFLIIVYRKFRFSKSNCFSFISSSKIKKKNSIWIDIKFLFLIFILENDYHSLIDVQSEFQGFECKNRKLKKTRKFIQPSFDNFIDRSFSMSSLGNRK